MVTPPAACLTMGLEDSSSLCDFRSKVSLAVFGFLLGQVVWFSFLLCLVLAFFFGWLVCCFFKAEIFIRSVKEREEAIGLISINKYTLHAQEEFTERVSSCSASSCGPWEYCSIIILAAFC